MRDFSDETGDASVSDVYARPGSEYLMMDIGGICLLFVCLFFRKFRFDYSFIH